MKGKDHELTAKDIAAVLRYVETGSATTAYREVIARPGTSEKSIKGNAWNYFGRPHIKAEVERVRVQAIGDSTALLLELAAKYRRIHDAGMSTYYDANDQEQHRSLPAAKGALDSLWKLFGESALSTDSKLYRMKAWAAIQGDLALDYETKERVTQAILNGDDL